MKSFAVAAAVFASSLAFPLQSVGKDGSFSVEYKHRRSADWNMAPEDRLAAIVDSHRRTKARYGFVHPDDLDSNNDVQEKLRKRNVGSTYMAGNQESYYASIHVGTPAKTFEVVLDTGSSDLVLAAAGASNLCGGQCTTDAPLYNPSDSSSARNTNEPVSLTYGTAAAEGVVVEDVVSFAGFQGYQALASCSSVDNLTTSADQTGLLGLGWTPLAQTNSTPFVEALWRNGSLSQPLFAFAFGETDPSAVQSSSSVVPGGIMTVGATNTSLYTGDINYVDLNDQGSYWDFTISDIGIGGQSLGITTQEAILDTGTNSIAIPTQAADAIYSQIPNAQPVSGSGGIYAYPCSQNVQLSLTMGGKTYTMPSKYFNTGPVTASGSYCAGAVTSLGYATRRNPESLLYIVGSPFIQTQYTVFRFSPPSVGFATLNDANNILEKGPIPNSNDQGNATSTSSIGGGSSNSLSGNSATTATISYALTLVLGLSAIMLL